MNNRVRIAAIAVIGITIALAAFTVARAAQSRAGERPVISGTPEVGETLTSSSAGDTAVYKWESCDPAVSSCVDAPAGDSNWAHIAGGNDQTYTVTSADAGHFLRVVAKGTSLGESFVSSLPVGPVGGTLPPSTPPSSVSTPAPQNLIPDNGQDVLINVSSGLVLIKIPGERVFRPVTELQEIPIGSLVNTTKGVATITSENGEGIDEQANFWGGIFKALQDSGFGSYFEARIVGLKARKAAKGASGRLATSAAVAHTAAANSKLWGSGSGKFRTRGKGGVATLRGTTWLTKEKGDCTLFKVVEGHGVDVKDFGEKGTIFLEPGDKYCTE